MKKNRLTWLIYISVLFLVITLVRKDYIAIPKEINFVYLIYSIIVLFTGFLLQALSYKLILKSYGYNITKKDSIISFGISILSRYIPGKFWVHLGRGEYIHKHYGFPVGEMIYISLYSQFMGLWNVVFFSSVGLLFIKIDSYLKILIAVFWLFLNVVIFTKYFHKLAQIIIFKVLKKRITIPTLSPYKNLKLFPVFFAFWLLYSIAFYLLAMSFFLQLDFISLIYFPVSTAIGIVAVFVPGGIGLREASLVGFLTLEGVSLNTATTLAAFSRLWFLIGELFSFALSMVLNALKK